MRVPARRVLVLGGYGTFGRQACAQLVRRGIDVVVAGRSLEHAQQCAAALRPLAGGSATPLQMDGGGIEPGDIAAIGAAVVINASGPFQLQDYGIARASIAAGAHYVDLADARTFVVGIGALDAQARRAGVLVAAGASTVPALSSAVIDAYAPQFGALAAARIVIAPSNSFDPGLATARSILGMLGKPFPAPQGAATRTLYGWQGLRRWRLPGLGARWLGLCEVPDLDVLPPRYPGRPSVRVYAALEIGLLHLGLWGLSWLVRAGLLRRPERLAAPLLALQCAHTSEEPRSPIKSDISCFLTFRRKALRNVGVAHVIVMYGHGKIGGVPGGVRWPSLT